MALSTLPVLDVTGGVLTTVGVIFAGFSTRGKRRRIVESFEQEIEGGRARLANELEEKLKAYISTLRKRIEANFSRFDEMLDREKKNLLILEGTHAEIERELETLAAEI